MTDVQPSGPGGTWALMWSDEFGGSSVDTTKWWVDDGGTTRNGIPCYASNVTVSGGYLRITALNASSGGNVMSADCQPGTTAPSNGYRLPVGGCVEARVTFPGDGAGSIYNWPAFWALGTVLGSPYPAAGEIDIAEVNGWGGGPGGGLTINYHGTTNSYTSSVIAGAWDSAFHTYTLVRHESSYDVYFDGVLKGSHATGDDGSAMGILLVNGKGGIASYPQTMLVDYVRAWAPSYPPPAWTQVQVSAEASAQNSVPAAFTATTAGNMLVACLAAPSGAGFTPPGPASNGSVWKRGPRATCAGGTVEQWYLHPAPAGMTSATFTTTGVPAGYACRGFVTEQHPPDGTVDVFFGATGAATGTDGASFTVNAVCGNAASDLGVYLAGVFFSPAAPVTTGWVTPGFSELRSHRTGVTTCFWAGVNGNLTAGVQPAMPGGLVFSGASSAGYAAVFGAYQALAFVTPRIDGAEVLNVIASDPAGQVLIAGGDVWGPFRSCDGGDTWRAAQSGFLNPAGELAIGCVQWSAQPGEPTTVYAVTGKSEDGGIFRSADGGVTWAKHNSTALGFRCNDAGSPPRPAGNGMINDRSAGRLLAQDGGRGIMLAATHHDGVYRSTDGGVTWANIGLSGVYLRGLVCDPAVKTVFAAAWDSPAGTGGVYQCYDYTAGSPSWSQNTNTIFTVSDLLLLGGYVYALRTDGGLYRHRYSPYLPDSFPNVNPAGVDTSASSIWTGMDGYVSGTDHVIVMACHQGVKHAGKTYNSTALRITIPAAGAGALEEIIADSVMDWQYLPDGTERWDYNIHTGTTMWAHHHVLVHPSDRARIYIVGGAQTFRSYDSGATWHLANIGQCSFGFKVLAIDPVNPRHLVWCSDDYSHYDLTWPPGKLPGYDSADLAQDTSFPAPGQPESHAVCFEAASGDIYQANNTGYSQNTGGRVCLRRAGDATFTWINTNYHLGPPPGGAVTAGNAPMGLYAGRNLDGTRYLVVVTQGAGLFRATSADGGATWTWAQADALIGTSGNLNQHVPIVGTTDAALLYLFDRKRGVYRSTDRGATWTQVWAKVISSNTRCGWLAPDPADKSSLWVSTGDGLYHLPAADTQTYANPSSLPGFSGGAGGLAWSGSTLYVLIPPTAGTPYTRLRATADGGATWADVAGGDQFGATCADSRGLYVTSDGLLIAGTSTSLATLGQVPARAGTLAVTTASLPGGMVTAAYTAQLTAAGGTAPYTWEVTAGALPAGITLTGATGVLSGTPAVPGTASFQVRVTDTTGATATAALSIAITQATGTGTLTFVQKGTHNAGTTSVTLPLPVASTAGNLLVAALVCDAGNDHFTPPGGQGWQLGPTTNWGAGIRAEQWYLPGNPGGLGVTGPPDTRVVFTCAGATQARGCLIEWSSAAGTTQAIGIKKAAAAGTTAGPVTLEAAKAASAGAGAVAQWGTAFSAPPAGTYTGPGGAWVNDQVLQTSALSVWAGHQEITGGGSGWCSLYGATCAPAGACPSGITPFLNDGVPAIGPLDTSKFWHSTLPASLYGSGWQGGGLISDLPDNVTPIVVYVTPDTNVASFVESVDRPIIMIWANECESAQAPGVSTYSDYLTIFQRQSRLIRAAGNPNVQFMQCSLGWAYRNGGPADVLAGRWINPPEFVDGYLIDCYEHFDGVSWPAHGLSDFPQFQNWLDVVQPKGRPLGIGEYGIDSLNIPLRAGRLAGDLAYLASAFGPGGTVSTLPMAAFVYWWADCVAGKYQANPKYKYQFPVSETATVDAFRAGKPAPVLSASASYSTAANVTGWGSTLAAYVQAGAPPGLAVTTTTLPPGVIGQAY